MCIDWIDWIVERHAGSSPAGWISPWWKRGLDALKTLTLLANRNTLSSIYIYKEPTLFGLVAG